MNKKGNKKTINIVSSNGIKIFESLRKDGQKHPMTDKEIDEFVKQVRKERKALLK